MLLRRESVNRSRRKRHSCVEQPLLPLRGTLPVLRFSSTFPCSYLPSTTFCLLPVVAVAALGFFSLAVAFAPGGLSRLSGTKAVLVFLRRSKCSQSASAWSPRTRLKNSVWLNPANLSPFIAQQSSCVCILENTLLAQSAHCRTCSVCQLITVAGNAISPASLANDEDSTKFDGTFEGTG